MYVDIIVQIDVESMEEARQYADAILFPDSYVEIDIEEAK